MAASGGPASPASGGPEVARVVPSGRAALGLAGPGRPGTAGPVRRQAEVAAEPGYQDFDRQDGVGEVDVDALILGEPFPVFGGQPLPGLGLLGRDDAGDALGDGAAPMIFLALPPVPVVFGFAPCLLALLPQLHLEGDGAADAEEEAAEAGLRLPGAVEIADLEGGDALGLEAAGQPLGEPGQPGQHRGVLGGFVRGWRGGGGTPGFDGVIDHSCIRTK
ncbi:hypothetical protein QFZ27_004819 [Inquilinus ginsengisoli]|uniref:hypothetical protein n=1 Tax=Inquilinus ginsengisoli TaxID=363840 RepID=UPI003D19C84E